MPALYVNANGLNLWTESFGNPDDVPVLLIAGASAQAIFWEDDFCRELSRSGRFVIRYDNRDTGQSDSVDFSVAPYTFNDLALDAVHVLDAYGVTAAHVVGASGGGLICQALALEHRNRIVTMSTLLSSLLGTGSSETANGGYGDLPPPSTEFLESLQEFVGHVPEDRDGFAEWTVRKYRLLAGSIEPFESEIHRSRALREFDRARNLQAMNNHALAAANSAAVDRRHLSALDVPTLVVHGTEDPLLPYAHGKAIADTVPGAKFLTIEKMGHDLPRAAWPQIIPALLQHTESLPG